MEKSVAKFLDQRFHVMEADGFPLLTRIPSYEASRFPITYRSLTQRERELFRRFWNARALCLFVKGAEIDGALQREYMHTLAARFIDRSHVPASARPLAKAQDLRRAAKSVFSDCFGTLAERSHEPGDWLYRGTIAGHAATIRIRYSTRMAPLWYTVEFENAGREEGNLEILYGFGLGCWDLVTEDRLGETFSVLPDVISTYACDFARIRTIVRKAAEP